MKLHSGCFKKLDRMLRNHAITECFLENVNPLSFHKLHSQHKKNLWCRELLVEFLMNLQTPDSNSLMSSISQHFYGIIHCGSSSELGIDKHKG